MSEDATAGDEPVLLVHGYGDAACSPWWTTLERRFREAGYEDDRVETLGVVDVTVDRNAFGRQVDSFEAPLDVDGLDDPFPAVFIRAPLIDEVGADVEVLAEWDGKPVAVRDGPVVGTSFHPELTPDVRIHRLAFFADAADEIDVVDDPFLMRYDGPGVPPFLRTNEVAVAVRRTTGN